MRLTKLAILASVVIYCSNLNAQDATGNLLKGFSGVDAGGNPQGWSASQTNPVFIDPAVKAGDGSPGLRVDIRNKGGYSAIQQDVTVKKNTAYSFNCQVRGSSRKLGFLGIVLRDQQGKNIKGIISEQNLGDSWNNMQIDFQSENAEKITACLQFSQSADALGESVWFANPRLTTASAAPPAVSLQNKEKISAPELSAVPLFAGCSIYIKYGDGDYSKCNLAYRTKGGTKWNDAFPPVNVKTDTLTKFTPVMDHMFRGCIVNLNEDTEYEVKAELLDSNGRILNTLNSEFKTLSSSVPVKKTVNITGELKAGPVSLTGINGAPDGWIKYVADPGTVIDGGAIEDAAIQIRRCSYLILEGLTVTGGKRHCIDILRSQNIRIINCDVSGWGRIGRQDFNKKGVYYDETGREIDFDNGFNIYNSGNVLIERCYAHDPRGTANSWFYYHPEGPQAVGIMSTGGTVLRYNDFIGSDEHRWNDVVSGYDNGSKTGGFYRDGEVYGNMLALGNDDGLEFDGGQMNCRFFKNKVDGTLVGISLAPNMLGPSYVYNNLFVNLGDQNNLAGCVFKAGGGSTYAFGMSFIFNNTAYTNGYGISSVSYGSDKNRALFNGYSRNNMLACRSVPVYDREKNPASDFDYDLMCNRDLLDNNYIQACPGVEKHGVIALPEFKNKANADFNLSARSRGIGEGVTVPDFAPGINGKADIGAFESGKDSMLPYRPLPLTYDKGQINLKVNLTGKTSTSDTVTVTVKPDSKWTGAFKIVKNKPFDWITVEPAGGVFKAGEPVRFTVSADPAKIKNAGLKKGLFLARMEDGFSVPVSVYANAVSDSRRATVKLAGSADFPVENDPKCVSGKYYNLDRESWKAPGEKSLEFTVEVPSAGIYYVFLRTKSPVSPSAQKSCYIAVDGGAPQPVSFDSCAADWIWVSVKFPDNKREPGTQLNLTAGRHSIKIYPRAKIFLDTVVVSPDQVLE